MKTVISKIIFLLAHQLACHYRFHSQKGIGEGEQIYVLVRVNTELSSSVECFDWSLFPRLFSLYHSNVSYWSKMKNHGALGTRRLLKKWRPSENVGRKMDSEAVHTWTREEVSSCNCSEKHGSHGPGKLLEKLLGP